MSKNYQVIYNISKTFSSVISITMSMIKNLVTNIKIFNNSSHSDLKISKNTNESQQREPAFRGNGRHLLNCIIEKCFIKSLTSEYITVILIN